MPDVSKHFKIFVDIFLNKKDLKKIKMGETIKLIKAFLFLFGIK